MQERSALIVEDSAAVRVALRTLLESMGHGLVAEASGENQATEWLERNPRAWSLAVVDLLLLDGSGFGVIRRCRQAHPSGVIVVFSDFTSPAIARKCRELGADAVFPKQDMSGFTKYVEQCS